MWNSLKTLLFWLPALAMIGTLMSFKNSLPQPKKGDYQIDIQGVMAFVVEDDLRQILDNEFVKAKTINTHMLEEKIIDLNGVTEVEVFSKLDEELHVRVVQAKPLLRLFENGRSAYLSHTGKRLALSPYESCLLPIVQGWPKDSAQAHELMAIWRYIVNDSLLNSSIDGGEINERGEITLFSPIGHHEVVMGSSDNWENKLQRLKIFYQNVLLPGKRNVLKKLDLRFNNQIVLSK